MTREEIGGVLAALRKAAGYSREEVAEKLGKSPKSIGHWETGHAMPDANLLFVLCDLYGADINRAFGFGAKKASPISGEAMLVARAYDLADEEHKDIVKTTLSKYMGLPSAKESPARLA